MFGSLLMAKYIDRLPEGTWMVISFTVMGIVGVLYGLASNIWVAIVLVTISGFAQPPSSIARALVFQRNTPREFRGRVFSAFFVSRDVLFLLGMATAGLADIIDIRLLIVAASLILIGVGGPHPAVARPRPAGGGVAPRASSCSARPRRPPRPSTVRPAIMLDFDKLAMRLPALALLEERRRESFVASATVREAETGATIVHQGDAGDAAYFILGGSVVAGTPNEDGSYRSLSSMGEGEFFGEIAALTGSRRTANVVADAADDAARGAGVDAPARHGRPGPQLALPVGSQRAPDADPGRRPAAPVRQRPGGPPRPAHAEAERRGAAEELLSALPGCVTVDKREVTRAIGRRPVRDVGSGQHH